MGWLTLFSSIFGILPLYLILYVVAGVLTAFIKNKTKGDHVRFWCMGFVTILSALTFVDRGDVETSAKIIKFLPDNVLLVTSCLFFVLGFGPLIFEFRPGLPGRFGTCR